LLLVYWVRVHGVDHFFADKLGIATDPALKSGSSFNMAVQLAWLVPVGIAMVAYSLSRCLRFLFAVADCDRLRRSLCDSVQGDWLPSGPMQIIMLISCVTWFSAAPFWMKTE